MKTLSQSRNNRLLVGLVAGCPAALALAFATVAAMTMRQQDLDARLASAVRQDKCASVRLLLRCGADANARISQGPPRSLLQIIKDIACGKLRQSNSKSKSVLALAVEADETTVVRTLLNGGAAGVNDTV